MKSLLPSLLIGAVSAASSPQQQVLQPAGQVSDAWTDPSHSIQDPVTSLTGEDRTIWDEFSRSFPEHQATLLSHPKKHTRRPDSHWDYIIKGADVQSIWVQNENGERERELDGRLESYNMRSKKVDPSLLGVDPGVKQYSGYLDDEENDKHLFYCEARIIGLRVGLTDPQQGSSNLEMIPRMTQSSCGSTEDQDVRL